MVMPLPLAAFKRSAGACLSLAASVALLLSASTAYAQTDPDPGLQEPDRTDAAPPADAAGDGLDTEARADEAFRELEDAAGLADPADNASEGRSGTWHTVASGETLATISSKYYGSALLWWRIAEANRIDDPRTLTVGKSLLIPAPPAMPELKERDADRRYHIVAEGDTLGRISKRYYGTTDHWRAIARVNGIERNNWIRVGQLLLIPDLDDDGADRPAQPAVDTPRADPDAIVIPDDASAEPESEQPQPVEPEYPGYFGTSGESRDRAADDDGYLPPDRRDGTPRGADPQPRAHPRGAGDAGVEEEEPPPARHEWGWATFGVEFRNVTSYWSRNYGFDTLAFTFDSGLLLAGGEPNRSYSRDSIGDWGAYFLFNFQADLDLDSGELARIGGSIGMFFKLDRFELIWRENLFIFDDRTSTGPLPNREEFYSQIYMRVRLPIFGNTSFFGVDVRHRYVDTDDDFWRHGIYWDVWEGAGWRFGFVAFGHDPLQIGLGTLLPEKIVFNLAADDPDFGSGWTDIQIVWGVNVILGGRSTLAPTGGAFVLRFEFAWQVDLGPSSDELRWATSISYTFF